VFKLGRSFCAGLCSRSAAETAAEFGVTEKNGGFRRSFLVGEQSEESSSCSGLGGAESDGTRRIMWRDCTGNKSGESPDFTGVNKSAVSADFCGAE
jgi:hypothetical protein